MIPVLQAAASLLALACAAPVAILAANCLAGIVPRARLPDGAAPPFAVLIPAHDEERLIADTVACVRAQLRACDTVLVVADHCRDRTAQIALAAGARVAIREGSADRGKGHALAFGRQMLRRDPRDVVILVDADCRPAPGALHRLAATAIGTGGAVQGAYLLRPLPDAAPLVRISTFAFMVKNLVRQRSLDRLWGAALLQGSGMAFPWPMFDTLPLASASLVEDLELGLDLLLAGRPVRFDEAARITSPASSPASTGTQRRRWEHGMLAAQRRYLPPLARAVLAGRLRLLGGAMLLLGAALGLVWLREGRELLPPAMIGRLPGYFLWKLPLLAQFVFARERRWVRTERQP